jgi:CotH kinase protein
MHFIAWDQDFSFGNSRNNSGLSIHRAWSGNNRFLARLFGVEAFRSKYLARMAEFSERLFLTERFAQQVREIGPAIRPSVALEGAEWLDGVDRAIAGTAGIVPYVTSRAAIVTRQLQQGQ